MNDLAELGALVERQQDAWLAQQSRRAEPRQAFVRAFRQHRQRAARASGRWPIAAGALAAAAILLLVVWARRPTQLSAVVVGDDRALLQGADVAAPRAQKTLKFSDGSRVVLKRGARVRLGELKTDGADLGLVEGSLSVSVEHRPDTAWSVRAGPYRVRITGTRFNVAWDQATRQFQLDRLVGEVRVSGGSLTGERVVRTGQTLRLPETPTAATPDHPASAPENGAQGPDANETPALRHRRAPVGPSKAGPEAPAAAVSWLEHARAGEYDAAYAQADSVGFSRLTETASAGELIVLADVARFSGHGAKAHNVLTTLRRRFGGSNDAATAAFQLGRLSGSSPEAARWFRTYLDERPSGSLAREASGRLMELLARLGNENAARAQARDYLKRYPSGPHAAFARRLAGP